MNHIDALFNDKELHKIDPNLTLLPDELKRDIYEKNLYPNRLVYDLLEELKSNESAKLDTIKLRPILQRVLKDKLAIDYLLNNYIYTCPYNDDKRNLFKELYEYFIINKNKQFVLIQDPVEDFALTWVHYMYK